MTNRLSHAHPHHHHGHRVGAVEAEVRA